MFKVVIFLCASHVFGADCTYENAIAVNNAGDTHTQAECMMRAQVAEASYPITIDPAKSYWKVSCVPPEQVSQAKGRDEDPTPSPIISR